MHMSPPPTPHIAYDPGSQLVYGVGRTPAEAHDDAEFQAGVIVGGSRPWAVLMTRPCSCVQALEVDRANGPVSLAQLGLVA